MLERNAISIITKIMLSVFLMGTWLFQSDCLTEHGRERLAEIAGKLNFQSFGFIVFHKSFYKGFLQMLVNVNMVSYVVCNK